MDHDMIPWAPSNVTVELMIDYIEDMANNWHDAPGYEGSKNIDILYEIVEEAMFLVAREEGSDA